MLIKKNLTLVILGLFSIFVVVFAVYAIKANNKEESCRAQAKTQSRERVLRENPSEQNQDVIGRKAFDFEQQLLMRCLKENRVD